MTTCNATRLLGVACVLVAAPAAAADLNGMWRIETPGLSLPGAQVVAGIELRRLRFGTRGS